MKGESQVEVALLVLLLAETHPDVEATSEFIGEAAGASPVVVRRIYKRLKVAGLLDTKPGRYGLHLARNPRDISLLDIVEAVRPLGNATVFGVEAPLSGTCPISGNIFDVLTAELDAARAAMRERLASVSLHKLTWKLPATYDAPINEKIEVIHEYLREAGVRYPADGALPA